MNSKNYWKISTLILTIILISITIYGNSIIKSTDKTIEKQSKNISAIKDSLESCNKRINDYKNEENLESNIISRQEAGEKVLNFAESQGSDAKLIDVSSEESLYKIILLIDEQEAPVYITKDGKTLVPQPIPLAN